MRQAQFFYHNKNAPKPNRPNHIGTSVLIEYRDKLLLEHRTDSETWAIIGGGLKTEESLAECAVREVYEECASVREKIGTDEISGHRIIAENVFETTYANGTQVLVNYNLYDVELPDGSVLEAESYLLKEGK